ncbi:MAG: hypothetical protein JNK85_09755 [Verrucomicrobiales bacterium]|nr:hypothetical protein [Verrucomicrobiales bacterium]
MKHLLSIAIASFALLASAPIRIEAQESVAPRVAAPDIDPGNLRAFIALARADLKTEKTLIIAQNIDFTADEAAEFWPLHSEYNVALNRLLDERLVILGEYVSTYQNMSDREATNLARQVFDLEAKRVKLKRTWFKKFSKVIPAKKAAQFFQIENQLNAALDLQLAAALPLIR